MVGSVSRLTTAVHSLGIRAITSGSNIGRGTVGNFGVGSVSVGVKLLGQLMGWGENSSDLQSNCQANCSHGECYNGTCFCEVGLISHHVSFALFFNSFFFLYEPDSIWRCSVCWTKCRLSCWFRQCFSSSGSDITDSTVYLYSCWIRSTEDAIISQSMSDHEPKVSIHSGLLSCSLTWTLLCISCKLFESRYTVYLPCCPMLINL